MNINAAINLLKVTLRFSHILLFSNYIFVNFDNPFLLYFRFVQIRVPHISLVKNMQLLSIDQWCCCQIHVHLSIWERKKITGKKRDIFPLTRVFAIRPVTWCPAHKPSLRRTIRSVRTRRGKSDYTPGVLIPADEFAATNVVIAH